MRYNIGEGDREVNNLRSLVGTYRLCYSQSVLLSAMYGTATVSGIEKYSVVLV